MYILPLEEDTIVIILVQGDSKLLSRFLWRINGISDSNFESTCVCVCVCVCVYIYIC
jgi:hypothetical protein